MLLRYLRRTGSLKSYRSCYKHHEGHSSQDSKAIYPDRDGPLLKGTIPDTMRRLSGHEMIAIEILLDHQSSQPCPFHYLFEDPILSSDYLSVLQVTGCLPQ